MEDRYRLSFLRSISRSSSDPTLTDAFKDRIAALSESFQILDKAASFFYVFDFVQMRYLYVSEGLKDLMGGYTARDWMERGPEWVLSLVYPEDVRRLKDLHKALFEFYYSLPISERKDLKYAWEFRLTRKDGRVMWLMQQGSFFEVDEDGKPMITFDTLSDTSALKKDNSMTLTMFRDIQSPRLKLYFPISGSEPFSKREVEILRLLVAGFTSKEIADRLCISSHTVDTHRRHMLRKADVKDTARLVMFGRENGLV